MLETAAEPIDLKMSMTSEDKACGSDSDSQRGQRRFHSNRHHASLASVHVANEGGTRTGMLGKGTNGLSKVKQERGDDVLVKGVDGEPSIEELESQLPVVLDDQIPLGDLISRMVQAIYAELTEMAET